MTDFLVLLNPTAGSVSDVVDPARPESVREDEQLRGILEELDRHGTTTVVMAEGSEAVLEATEDLPDGTVYVVIGGDGTLHRTLNALKDRPRDYLLIPGGTGNDFAGGAGLPEDLVEAARLATTGNPVGVDLIEVGDRVAINAAHVGIGVHAAEAAADLKARLGKLAYPAGAVAAAGGFEPIRVTITLDGDVVVSDREVAMVGVCNGPVVGGGTALCPVADPTDGRLDLVVLLAATRPALAATTAALIRGQHLDRDDVLHRQGSEVTIEVHGCDEVGWNIDGELEQLPPTTTCRIRPSAWQLYLPGR